MSRISSTAAQAAALPDDLDQEDPGAIDGAGDAGMRALPPWQGVARNYPGLLT